jgi:Amt family ammonium transporter
MNPVGQLVAQAIAVLVVMAWSAIGSTIVALMASLFFPMRVSAAAVQASLAPATPDSRS